MRTAFGVVALLASCIPLYSQAPPPAPEVLAKQKYIKVHYTKHEFMIPMRDGVKLFTQVFTPKDDSQAWPILLNRTPYQVPPYGIENYPTQLGPGETELFVKEGFIFVRQDVRGKGHSEGTYVHVRPVNPKKGPKDFDEPSDTYDTMDWLVKHVPNNNGKAGIYGISYPGFYATMAAIDPHPSMKAVSPQAPVTDWFNGDDFRHNGVFFLPHAFGFFGGFGQEKNPDYITGRLQYDMGTPDGYDFFRRMGPLLNADEKYFHSRIEYWRELVEHDVNDAYWQSRNPAQYLKAVKPAMLTVGGWFDAEDVLGPLAVFRAVEKQSPESDNRIVEGPWSHGGWSRGLGDRLGNARFKNETSKYFQESIEYPFFLWYLKAKGEGGKLPKAYVFETGRDEWHKLASWPPKEAQPKTLYFHEKGTLSFGKPTGAGDFDEYISDPNKPVPFTPEITGRMTYNYMVEDQRFASARPDVLTYETEPLTEDFRIAGPLKASLFVSTTGTDSDFVVKLIDVYPGDYPDAPDQPSNIRMGGYQQLLRGEPFRGKFRKSTEKPKPFLPGKMDQVAFELPDVFHTFRVGHRIMVQVQSSWFPLCDLNPQKFMKISEAKAADFQKATQHVYRSAAAPSSLTVMALP
jgi:putative CocE/NonD family hydrolase